MHKLIMCWKNTLALAVVVTVLCLFQYGAGSELILKKADIWEGTPVFAGWEEDDENKVKMKVVCGDKDGYISEGKVVVNYLKNPNQPLPVSVLYEDGHVAAK